MFVLRAVERFRKNTLSNKYFLSDFTTKISESRSVPKIRKFLRDSLPKIFPKGFYYQICQFSKLLIWMKFCKFRVFLRSAKDESMTANAVRKFTFGHTKWHLSLENSIIFNSKQGSEISISWTMTYQNLQKTPVLGSLKHWDFK